MLDNARPVEINGKFEENFASDPALSAKRLMLTRTALEEASFDAIAAGKMQFAFSKEVKTLPVTNQLSSGRCWIFAALNVLREKTAKELGLSNLEFSQNYIAFWDKLEKINYFLESILDTADREPDDRTVSFLLQTGIADGGQWDMIVALIKKYGVVPKTAMPETYQSSHTAIMNRMLNMRLREMAAALRDAKNAGKDTAALKDAFLQEMYNALVICFGEPPKSFDFEYTDKNGVYHVERDLTAKAFYDKYVGIDLSEYVSIINAPTPDKPFGKTFTVKYLGNVIGADPILYYNVEMDTLKDLIMKQLNDDEVVWFGSDVGKFGARKEGIWDKACFGYETVLSMPLTITKQQQLMYRDSAMTHAMVITGYNVGKDGAPDRWKIENSWGEDRGSKGYYVMGAEWFDQYVYQAVIHKKYLSAEILEKLSDEPIALEPWDPMGSLA